MSNQKDNELNQKSSADMFDLEDILAEFAPDDEEESVVAGEVSEPEQTQEAQPESEEPQPTEPVVDIDDGIYAPVTELEEEDLQPVPDLSELLSMEVALDENEGDITGDPFEPLPEDKKSKVWKWEGESVEPLPDGGLEFNVGEKSSRAAKARNKWTPKAETITLEEDDTPLPKALKDCSRQVKAIWARLLPAIVLCLPSVYITVCSAFGLPILFGIDENIQRWILIGLNLAILLLCYEVPVEGVRSLVKLRPTMESGAVFVSLFAILHGILSNPVQGLPYCAVTTVAIFMCQWGLFFGKAAIRRSLRAAMNKEKPYVIVRQEEGFEDGPAFFKTVGDTEGFVAMAKSEDCGKKAMSYFVPILAMASLILSFLCYYLKQADFLACLTACLCAGLPFGGALCFSMPYAFLSKRLASVGAAIGGWYGANAVGGSGSIVITDTDLFPHTTLKIEGLKIFGSFSVDRVVGYTTALIIASGSCLTEVFKNTLESEKVNMPYIDTFQTYEGGGLGAEINGDLVLVGSSNFMTLMGVKIAQGSKVRNGVYVAINGEIAGLFAVNYRPAKSIAFTLASMLRTKKLSIVMATRDFNITPTMMRRSFEINCDNIELPTIEQRVDLSDSETVRSGEKAAIVCKEGLPPFGDAVVGGRALKRIARTNTVVSLVAGGLGLLLMFYLSFMGASTAAVAGYVLIYALAWALPVLLISRWAAKY